MTALLIGFGLLAALLIYSRMRNASHRLSLRTEYTAGSVSASGFDTYGENIELGSVSIYQAQQLFNDRCAFASAHGGNDENAHETGIMFYRSDDNYVGFYARSSDQIDIDAAPALKAQNGHRLVQVSRAGADRILQIYFRSPAEFVRELVR